MAFGFWGATPRFSVAHLAARYERSLEEPLSTGEKSQPLASRKDLFALHMSVDPKWIGLLMLLTGLKKYFWLVAAFFPAQKHCCSFSAMQLPVDQWNILKHMPGMCILLSRRHLAVTPACKDTLSIKSIGFPCVLKCYCSRTKDS